MITLTNLTNYKINEDFLKKAAVASDLESKNKILKEISLVFVTENKIKEINRQYRRKNEATDILSFAGLNEIFICPDFVQKQAKILKTPFAGELMRVLIHGILHLKGFDHEKSRIAAEKMRKKEEEILRKINGRAKK